MLGIFKSLGTTLKAALRKPVTVEYPDEKRTLPARNRGLPLLVWDHEHNEPVCIGCQQCAKECPVECITVAGPVENPYFLPKDHDEAACRVQNQGVCRHKSPRRTLPAESLKNASRFMIDEDRCMRCGICEEVCPTDQERYGNQKAIVLGTGHLSIQSAVHDRSNNVLDLDGLTYHSRVLKLELNAVMGKKAPKENLVINSPDVEGLRLSEKTLPQKRRIPTRTRIKITLLKLYAPLWLLKKKLLKKNKQ